MNIAMPGRYKWFVVFVLSAVVVPHEADAAGPRPNVVLIVCDDLNDFVTGMGGHPQAQTPHLASLAKSGVAFKRAYTNNPICAPSRSSFLTGIYPHTSGNLFFDKWHQNPVLNNCKTLMEYFRDNGYHVAGSGKLMHHHRPKTWSEFKHKADYGPFVYDGKEEVAHPSVPEPFASIGRVDGSFAPLSDVPYAKENDQNKGWVYGRWGKRIPFRYKSATDRDPTPDERNATWAANRIRAFAEEKKGKLFFLAVGFLRPHTPLHVPKKYFDQFPLQQVKLPVIKEGDAKDCHYRDVLDAEEKGPKYFRLLKASYPSMEEGLRAFTQAYLASIAAVDDCIGEVVGAVDEAGIGDNTIIVVTSDHGWNMGEKDYLFKNALWEESARVPLVMRVPGVTHPGGVAEHPVSIIDLYPTLADLCGLTGDTRKNDKGARLEGHSLRPFLTDPTSMTWDGPDAALTMVYAGPESDNELTKQHWAVRTLRWRYILYGNGSEELYDHDADPHEWNNLEHDPKHEAIKTKLRAKLMQQAGLKQEEGR